MIDRKSIALGFVKLEPVTGSDRGMRYRLSSFEEENEKKIDLAIYPEPYSYEDTDEAKILHKTFPLSEEGLDEAISLLNKERQSNKVYDEIYMRPLKAKM